MHVLDASRAVGVVAALKSAEQRTAFADENRREQERAREQYRGPSVARILSSRKRAATSPSSTGKTTSRPCPASPARANGNACRSPSWSRFIDWTPFFHAWELKGAYPRILEDKTVGPRAKELLDDAQPVARRKLSRKNR